MKITAEDMVRFGVVDEIVTEPIGGAHRETDATIRATGEALAGALEALDDLPPAEIKRQRRDKFLAMGRGL